MPDQGRGVKQRNRRGDSQRGWRKRSAQRATQAPSPEQVSPAGTTEASASKPLSDPLQLLSGVQRLFGLLCKIPQHCPKSKWHHNPLGPKVHNYKKMQSPYTTGKSRAMELRVLQALVQTPSSPNRPSKKLNKSNKINQSWQKVMQIKLHCFFLFMSKLASDKNTEFLSYFYSLCARSFLNLLRISQQSSCSWSPDKAKDVLHGWL